ncbi:putative formate dehydrogenase, partial [Tolypocladium ophioglossoides CBS 100239]
LLKPGLPRSTPLDPAERHGARPHKVRGGWVGQPRTPRYSHAWSAAGRAAEQLQWSQTSSSLQLRVSTEVTVMACPGCRAPCEHRRPGGYQRTSGRGLGRRWMDDATPLRQEHKYQPLRASSWAAMTHDLLASPSVLYPLPGILARRGDTSFLLPRLDSPSSQRPSYNAERRFGRKKERKKPAAVPSYLTANTVTMVSFRPISRSLPLAPRAALFSTCSAASTSTVRPAASRAAGLANKLSSTSPTFRPRFRPSSMRALTTAREKVKVLLVLYDGGEHAKQVSALLGTTENELGIRKWLEDQGHPLVTTSDKEGENSKFDQELVDAEVIITTPRLPSFHPGYLTAERLAKAKKLKLAITAGIGSDHVDLNAANKTNGGITVAEVTGSNVVSVAEHVVMTILILVRNFVPAHEQVERGDWDVAAVAKQEYDLEGKVVGTVGVGRIGERVLRRLKAFDCAKLLYYDYQPLPQQAVDEIGCTRVESLEKMLEMCDVVTINCPLHEKTKGLFNKELISRMKPGSYLINTARGAIVVKEDVAAALKSGHLAGYGGDVWFPQPAPRDHPLRTAKNPFGGGNAMVPHMSGTSLDAQKRYADGTKAILQSYLSGKHDYRPEDLIVHNGDYATKAYGQRK